MAPFLHKIKTLFSSSSSSTSQTKSTTPSQSALNSKLAAQDSTTTTTTAYDPPSNYPNRPEVKITPPTPNLTPHPTQDQMSPVTNQPPVNEDPAVTSSHDSPVFDPKEVTVIFVLGGPGAGKGTQCAKLVKEYGFVHLSAGDLLRAEQARPDSKVGAMIKEYITEGKIVPMEVTIQLLSNAMQAAIDKNPSSEKRFLVDGFPRQMDQAVKFDESVCPGALVLFLVCPEPILLERLLERGKTSGRDDDNVESIKKRFKTFVDTSMPVVDYYRKMGKVVDIDSSKTIDDVYADIEKGIKPVLDRAAQRAA